MKEMNVYCAYQNEKIDSLPRIDEQEAFNRLQSCYEQFQDNKNELTTIKRIQILEKAIEKISENKDEIAKQASSEGGKPLNDSIIEINRAIDGIKVAIREFTTLVGTEIKMGITPSSENRVAYTKWEARGVVLAISAFNHPFNLIVHQVIPAIISGNPVLIKPASSTPLSCRTLLDILYESGLPKPWCQMIFCENEIIEKIVSDQRISFLTFIGSAKVGWYLRSKLAAGAKCVLEHGGVAPVIIDSSANLEKAIPALAKGGFYHAGQVCVSVQKIFVHKTILDTFIHKFEGAVKKLIVGDPLDIKTDIGPLISSDNVSRVHSWVEQAVSDGAKLLCGGKKISKTCYEPTILLNPKVDSIVSKEEIFGPVVCIYSYDIIDEAIKYANSLNYAFQASIFTNDLNNSFKAIENLKGLAVMVNDHTAFRVDWMPFGGYQNSGLGIGGIGHSIKDMMIEKMFVINRN